MLCTGKTLPSGECREFLGACIDTAAQKSVIRNKRAVAYSSQTGQVLEILKHRGKTMFNFGDHRHNGLGTIEGRIPTDDKCYLFTIVEIVDVDNPFLLGLDFLDRFEMILDTAKGVLESKGRTGLSRLLGNWGTYT